MIGITRMTKRNLADQTPESRLRNIRDEIQRQMQMQYSIELVELGTPLADHGFDDPGMQARLAATLQRNFPDFNVARVIAQAKTFDDVAIDLAQLGAACNEQQSLI